MEEQQGRTFGGTEGLGVALRVFALCPSSPEGLIFPKWPQGMDRRRAGQGRREAESTPEAIWILHEEGEGAAGKREGTVVDGAILEIEKVAIIQFDMRETLIGFADLHRLLDERMTLRILYHPIVL
jgi:hypothetical protein